MKLYFYLYITFVVPNSNVLTIGFADERSRDQAYTQLINVMCSTKNVVTTGVGGKYAINTEHILLIQKSD